MTMDVTQELSQLLIHVADVATAIRLNSAYSEEHSHRNRENVAHDVMWLSDYLHCLDRLGLAIQSGNAYQIVTACDALQDYYRMFIDGPSGQKLKGDPRASIERHQHLVRPMDAITVLSVIRERAMMQASMNETGDA